MKRYNDSYLRRHVAYANRIAAFVGEVSRGLRFDEAELRIF